MDSLLDIYRVSVAWESDGTRHGRASLPGSRRVLRSSDFSSFSPLFFRLSAVLQVRKYFHDQVRREEKTRRRRRGRRRQESPSSLSNQNLSSSDPTSPSSPLLQRQQPTSPGFPSSPSLFSSPSTQPQESLGSLSKLSSFQPTLRLPPLPSLLLLQLEVPSLRPPFLSLPFKMTTAQKIAEVEHEMSITQKNKVSFFTIPS